MSSVLLQVGQCGNQIGDEFWRGVFDDTPSGSGPAGCGFSSSSCLRHNVWRCSDGCYRSINVDTEVKVLNRLNLTGRDSSARRGNISNGNQFKLDQKVSNIVDDGSKLSDCRYYEPQNNTPSIATADRSHEKGNMCTSRHLERHRKGNQVTSCSGRGSNWALGYHADDLGYDVRRDGSVWGEMCVGMVGRTMEILRKEVERCDSFQGVVMLHSLAGGTGSGLGSRLAEQIREDYPLSYLLSCPTLPFSSGESPLQHYNSLHCLSKLHQSCDAVLLLDNDSALNNMLRRQRAADRSQNPVSLQDMNSYLASSLLGAFLPVQPLPETTTSSCAQATRYSGVGSEPWDLVRVLCPSSNLKYLTIDTVRGFCGGVGSSTNNKTDFGSGVSNNTRGFRSGSGTPRGTRGFRSSGNSAMSAGGFSGSSASSVEDSLTWKRLVGGLTSGHASCDVTLPHRVDESCDSSLTTSSLQSGTRYLSALAILRGIDNADEAVFGPIKKMEKRIIERAVPWNPYPCEFWISCDDKQAGSRDRGWDVQSRKIYDSSSGRINGSVVRQGNVKCANTMITGRGRKGGINSTSSISNCSSSISRCSNSSISRCSSSTENDRIVTSNYSSRAADMNYSSSRGISSNNGNGNALSSAANYSSNNSRGSSTYRVGGDTVHSAQRSINNDSDDSNCLGDNNNPTTDRLLDSFHSITSLGNNYSNNVLTNVDSSRGIVNPYPATGSIKAGSTYGSGVPRRGFATVTSPWLTLVANSSSVVGRLEEISGRAKIKFTARAYVHWYERYGCSHEDFDEAFECVDGIISEYKQALV